MGVSVNRTAAFILFLMIVTPVIIYWRLNSISSESDFEIIARMAENGGWSQESLTVPVGEPLNIRLSSEDVVHGFAIGQVDHPAVDILPGEWTEFTWVPDQPGEYTFYCTRWCGPNHWRMTGTLKVSDPEQSYPTPISAPPPRYLSYEVDIDNRDILPELRGLFPSAERGSMLGVEPLETWADPIDPDLTTPLDAIERLKSDLATQVLTDEERWDLLAALWIEAMDEASLDDAKQLYDSNCSACHGSSGGGDGVMARHFTEPPVADFTDLRRMATANTVMLEGKILRGGMGTGMPYWGSIMTRAEIDTLIDYIWSFTFTSD
ncbi:MAG: c-type cytochrome [Anaerolineales bacterium]|nr:c-type cytochrome [Anaerolineales bacterium]